MRNALGNIPKGNNIMLIGNTDDCAQGAYQALKQGGFTNNIMVGANSAGPTAITAMYSDPNWVCEGAVFIQSWGAYLASMAVAKASGASLQRRRQPRSSR